MSDSIRAGELRICPACGSRNKATHRFCVRCSGAMDALEAGSPRLANRPASGNPRILRFLLAAGMVAALGAGLLVRSMLAEVPDESEVRADSAGTAVAAPAPAPPVSGWTPGSGVTAERPAPAAWSRSATAPPAPAWSATSFPVARPNPYDVPGDPNESMVGIAPSAPAVRAAKNRRRVYTEEDLIATRGGAWTAPTPAPE